MLRVFVGRGRGKTRGALLLALTALAVLAAHALAGGGEEETHRCHGREAKILGTSGDDGLPGTPGAGVQPGPPGRDVIGGGPGNDPLSASLGTDLVCGGAGDDVIHGGR